MHEDPAIDAWEDEVGHLRGARLLEGFVRAREDGVALEDLAPVILPKLRALTEQQREALLALATRRAQGPYDHAADGLGEDAA